MNMVISFLGIQQFEFDSFIFHSLFHEIFFTEYYYDCEYIVKHRYVIRRYSHFQCKKALVVLLLFLCGITSEKKYFIEYDYDYVYNNTTLNTGVVTWILFIM